MGKLPGIVWHWNQEAVNQGPGTKSSGFRIQDAGFSKEDACLIFHALLFALSTALIGV